MQPAHLDQVADSTSTLHNEEVPDDPDARLEQASLEALTDATASTTLQATAAAPATTAAPAPVPGQVLDASGRRVFLRLTLEGVFIQDEASASYLREAGGCEAIHRMTKLFYQKSIRDQHLSRFIMNKADPHAQRLGNWIVEKMGGEGQPWTEERAQRSLCPVTVTLADGRSHVVHDRTSAHVAAWFSTNRPAEDVGKRFKLPDAVIWMRLMFWSAREAGLLAKSAAFAKWYLQFIKHFIRVYEATAGGHVQGAYSWSEDEANLEAYRAAGYVMLDVVPQPAQAA